MERFSLEEIEQTLVEDYKNLEHLNAHTPHLVAANALSDFIDQQKLTYKLELPNILEVIWMTKNPNIIDGLTPWIRRNTFFWSGTPSKVWVPTSQEIKGALLTVKTVAYRSNLGFQVEKATAISGTGVCTLVPENPYIKRSFIPNEEQISECMKTHSLPRDFFIHRSHWEEFNKWSRRLQMNKLLTGGVYESNE